MAQLRKALRQVRPCSLFWAYQASMSIWRQDARVLFRSASQQRKPVAYLICSAADARRDVALVRPGPEPGKDVPGREEPDRLGVAGVGDAGQVPGKPALEGADVLVGRWQDSADHQEFFQVSCCPPGLEPVERVVGQRDLPEAELPQHLRGVPRLAGAHLQPGQPACGPVRRHQQAE
jgi:hypothetical protein